MQILIMKHICLGYDSKKHSNISCFSIEVETSPSIWPLFVFLKALTVSNTIPRLIWCV